MPLLEQNSQEQNQHYSENNSISNANVRFECPLGQGMEMKQARESFAQRRDFSTLASLVGGGTRELVIKGEWSIEHRPKCSTGRASLMSPD